MRDMTGKSFDGWTVCFEGKLRGNAFGFREKDGAHIAIINGGQRLHCGPNQPNALAKIEIERPDKAGVGRNGNRVLRKDEWTGRKIDHELHVFFRRHVLKALVIIHENKSAFSIGTNAPAQGVKIIFPMRTLVRHGRRHSGQSRTPFMEEKMEASQEMVLLADLTILAQGRLKVVVFNGHVVPIPRGLRFHQGGQFAFGIHAAVIHVVAGQGAARTELDERGGLGVLGIDKDAPVVAVHHAAANFAGEIRVLFSVRRVQGASFARNLTGGGIIHAKIGKMKPFPIAGRHGCEFPIPKAFRIDAVERNQFAERHAPRGFIPAGPGEDRRVESRFPAHAFERQ